MPHPTEEQRFAKPTEMDAFESSSYYPAAPSITFGTGSRPPMYSIGGGPGPGAYVIKTTLSKQADSNLKTPCQFSLRGRTKFGDPNEKSMNKTAAQEPGPGAYKLDGRFLAGKNPRDIVFPKGSDPVDKSVMGPGPGSYKSAEAMGKQPLSTKKNGKMVQFGTAARPSMAIKGQSDVGPGEYGPLKAACDIQVESTKRTCGTIKFGTGYTKYKGKKRMDMSEPSPGPGSYQIPEARMTRAATMSGRNKFGSPF